jgi:hypothetical protein
MAERIVSPGVFTNEVDQSFLAGGVAQINPSNIIWGIRTNIWFIHR